jgi:single-strand selective monofunctional uracil DNA glycosylase
VPASQLVDSAKRLRDAVNGLTFAPPVSHVYNPLDYAWPAHELYLRRYAASRKRVIFLGMNPGPFGMMQTGVPFGEITAVRDWLGIETPVQKPRHEHPKQPITGFNCPRSEVSGRRLWGLFADQFGTPARFFADHFVVNYCPLGFLEPGKRDGARNRTPDKLPSVERASLFAACNEHFSDTVRLLQPEWIIGIGDFAAKRAGEIFGDASFQIGKILHPSPASPAANQDWAGKARTQLTHLGVWSCPR